jgi:hypothetical protein
MALNCATAGDTEQTPEAGKFSYGNQGLQFDDGSGNNFLWFGVRLQTRWANERVTQDELPGAPVATSSELGLNRGRLKLRCPMVFSRENADYALGIIDETLAGCRT